MKYYLDTEFHEYQRKPLFSKPFRTIELISIGIVAEDGREYYAISKDFDLWSAFWNDWLRNNVLKPIFDELYAVHTTQNLHRGISKFLYFDFSYISFLILLKWYGKSNTQIAEEIKKFTETEVIINPIRLENSIIKYPEFYAYFADYDWVVFCWLFGKMIDLPKGFPMYCRDLKQMLDEKMTVDILSKNHEADEYGGYRKDLTVDEIINIYKSQDYWGYPKQTNEHNALADAKWDKELHKFIEKL